MNEDAAEHPDDALVRLGRAALKRLIDDPDAELTAAEEAMLRAAGRGEVADCATEPGDDRLACPHALDRFRARIRWNRPHG